jgi:hypothetical protein
LTANTLARSVDDDGGGGGGGGGGDNVAEGKEGEV